MSPGLDRAGFGALYQQTRTDVQAYLLRRCATAEDAADCLAETYMVAWERRDRIPEGDQARLWLFGVARNMLRRAHHRREGLQSATRALAQALQAADAARRGTGDRETDQLRDAMNELSELDREIITLIAWDNLTPGEVATVLDMSANVVRVRTHRARAKLRAALAPKGSTQSANLP